MAAKGEVFLDAGGRELRVSSADRVIFPATKETKELTKLDVVEYYLAVEDGIMRALRNRPTTLERWPKGVQPGMVMATRENPREGDAFYFRASLSHRFENPSAERCSYLAILDYAPLG